ncbi:hypothetical protein CDL12_11046 [Handroanthus impetiginosus]|uniref:ZF-HD dimerization-type domain-containing protein n=1 Tax=Handroanthus impetiginosus TaxID=429701 RepID=A0A2G9HG83_9LAMI|nr:hypothetical protein CDL12_11046 [Handroanthus impetiginosus]
MDLTNSTVKTPEAESETPTRIQSSKPSPFTNGVLKRHAPLHLHPPVVVTYKECLKNHAASIGGHAVDGCGEFMPSPTSNPSDPTSLKCAACGCHRNFHRRDPEEPSLLLPTPPNAAPTLEYRPHHRHHPPPPQAGRGNSGGSPNDSPSPPPISSAYYPSAPHMLLALSHGLSGPPPDSGTPISTAINTASTPLLNSNSRKRFRTKFTQDQKEKMHELADKVAWKMQKKDEDMINEFCSEIGVDKGVFKVWMHNNKNTFAKKDPPAAANGGEMNYSSIDAATEEHYRRQHEENNNNNDSKEDVHFHGTNGSSSSS